MYLPTPPGGEGIVLGLRVGVLPEEATGTGLPEALPEVVRKTRVQQRVHRGVGILQADIVIGARASDSLARRKI